MKFSLHHAFILLLAGMLLVVLGAFLKTSHSIAIANPVILSGLAFAFLGTLWLVLYLNQRRKKK